MPMEDAFNAAKVMSMMYGGFFKDVAKQIGSEKALALHAKQGELFGAKLEGMLRAEVADKGLTIKSLSSVLSMAPAVFGMTPEVEETATTVKVQSHACPIYDGCREAGLNHETIGLMCRAKAATEYAALTKAFPQISARLKFKSAADRPCIEEYSLAK